MDELISIVTPVYNSGEWLKKCINSIQAQTYKNFECVLVDDGSTDQSGSICDAFSQLDKRFKVYHIKNGGASAARNFGIQKVSGKYLCFIDSDDYVDPTFLEVLHKGIEGCQLAICGYSTESKCIIDRDNEGLCDKCRLFDAMLNPDNINACKGYLWNKMFVTENVRRMNLSFPENTKMWEDMLFCIKYGTKVDIAYFCPQSLYHYNTKNINSISHNLSYEVMQDWVHTAETIADILKANKMYESSKYNCVLTDLYMKNLLVLNKTDRELDQTQANYIENNINLLRKKYRIYFCLLKRFPWILKKII